MKLGLFSVLAVIVLASVSFALGDSCLDTCVNAPTGYDIDCACQAGCGQDNSGEFASKLFISFYLLFLGVLVS